jgi:hypothetical protein
MRDLNEAGAVTSDYLQRMKGVHQDIDTEGLARDLKERYKKQGTQDQTIQELK